MTSPLVYYVDRFWISPYAFSGFVALREKGLEYTVEPIGLDRGEQHDAAYAAGSITARVPSLRHGDFWVGESSAIVEYLEDAFPAAPQLLPKDVYERARARQVMSWIRSDLLALRDERPTTTMFYTRAQTPLSSSGKQAADKLVCVASALLPRGRTGLFSSWSIADADLAFMLHRLLLNGHDVPPAVRSFAEAQWNRPSVQAWVTHERPPYVTY